MTTDISFENLKLEEVIVEDEEYREENRLCNMVAMDIEAKNCSQLMAHLARHLPLTAYNLGHLKRMRNKAKFTIENNKLNVNKNESLLIEGDCKDLMYQQTSSEQSKQAKSTDILQVLICPTEKFEYSVSVELKQSLLELSAANTVSVLATASADTTPDACSTATALADLFYTVIVPKVEARNRAEFQVFGKIWPSCFRQNKIENEREKGFTVEEKELIVKGLEALEKEEAGMSQEKSSIYAGHGAVMVNPSNKQIVMTSSHATKILLSARNTTLDVLDSHPVYNPTLRVIEGVASMVRGDTVNNGSIPENFYLCSGLDLFVSQEPNAFTAMALVHSRIRRVYFKAPQNIEKDSTLNTAADADVFITDGAFSNGLHIHWLKSLNHRFRVFSVKK